jgi:hypothetical protein
VPSSQFPAPIIGVRFFYSAPDRLSALEEVRRFKKFLAAYGEVSVFDTTAVRKDHLPIFRYEFAGNVRGMENPEEVFGRMTKDLGTAWNVVSDFDAVLDIRFDDARFVFSNLHWAWIHLFDESSIATE